jgi:hypothetical protein
MSASPANPGPAQPVKPPSHRLRDFWVSPLTILVVSVVFALAVAFVCLALAFNWMQGYPESAQKNVAIYYQTSPGANGLAAYLHPPLNSTQAGGENQLLALQFTNRESQAVNIRSVQLFSADCFTLQAQSITAAGVSAAPASAVPLLKLDPAQSALLWYRLVPTQDSTECPGQSPLVFLYEWRHAPTPAEQNPPTELQSISTGPIRLTTAAGLHWERFFSLLDKIIAVILLPVLLAIGNYLLNELQQRRARADKKKDDEREGQQKQQEQKLEVWKAMIPSTVKAIRNHYVPIYRVLSILENEDDPKYILACAFLFRAKITHLGDDNGGYYFRNHRGEDLCADLTNFLITRFYDLAVNKQLFLTKAELVKPGDSYNQVRQALGLDNPPPGPFGNLVVAFCAEVVKTDALAALRAHATFLEKILDHEINAPFVPYWYETAPAELDVPKLGEYLKAMKLAAANQATIQKDLDQYLASLPPKP